MTRFKSIGMAPSETRQVLRARIRRLLPERRDIGWTETGPVMLSDDTMLCLLETIVLTDASDEATARDAYARFSASTGGQPSFDDLIGAGWFRILFGHVWTSMNATQAIRRHAASLPALAAFMGQRFGEGFNLARVPVGNQPLDDAMHRLAAGDIRLIDIGCQTPPWVAARLWERRPTDAVTPVESARWWLSRWALLGAPELIPSKAWDAQTASDLRKLLFDLLEHEPGLIGWADMRSSLAAQSTLVSGGSIADHLDQLPEVPDTLVARARWLDGRAVEAMIHENSAAHEDVADVARLLIAEVEAQIHVPAPHPVAKRLLQLAADRPDIMIAVTRAARRRPVLIADLLLHEPTCALACALVADFPSLAQGQDRELDVRSDSALKTIAFEDAVGVLAHFLSMPDAKCAEAASLLAILYDRSSKPRLRDTDASTSAILLAELARQQPSVAATIASTLITDGCLKNPDAPAFLAALDLIAAAGLAATIDGTALVDAYVRAVRSGAYSLSADYVSTDAAGALLTFAQRAAPIEFNTFLHPIDFTTRFASEDAETLFQVKHSASRAIRTMVRVLSRGIEALGDDGSDAAVEALAAAVTAGARDDAATGQCEAFSAADLPVGWTDPAMRPIAADLGAVLGVLTGKRREKVLQAIVSVNEPILLAELLSFAPATTHAAIRARIEGLHPDDAAALSSLTGAQLRVTALLNAQLPGPAAVYIDAEKSLTTMGKIPERGTTQLKHALHLSFLKGDWQAITNAAVPAGLPQMQREVSEDILAYYQALGALQDPARNPGEAIWRFEKLAAKHPGVPGYAINLLAAQIRELLGADYFGLLSSAERHTARRALDETEMTLARMGSATAADRDTLNANAAILLLAMGQPERAAERLETLSDTAGNPTRAAYQAIAMARTGRHRQALIVLDQAEARSGSTDLLKAARAHIVTGKGYKALPLFALEIDATARLRTAFWEFTRLGATQQAEIMGTSAEGFTGYVLGHVRSAATSIVNLVPMMDAVAIKSGEDDITALLRELLMARFGMVGWSVPDQSKGGYTAIGNPGERDLLLLQHETILTTIEAVIADNTIPTANLTSHFQKLLGYADSQLYFHLTYAWLDQLDGLIASLETIAKEEAPPQYQFQRLQALPLEGNQPRGFLATYLVGSEEIEVVFLALDMRQDRLRAAAGLAAKPKPKRSKGSKTPASSKAKKT
jgi:hypothetical protein